MTAAQNTSLAARATRPFKFYKGGVEFFPGVGARLHFASKETDTLTLPDMPAGMFSAGDTVYVTYNGARVFSGTVDGIIDRMGAGSDRVNDVTVSGPWAKMNRFVFRQQWSTKSAAGADATYLFSRIILNKTVTGQDATLAAQLQEIADYAATPCGFTRGSIVADTTVLPPDETRDLTCASAIIRELRFHPKRVVAFDYAAATPVLNIVESAATDAAYVATVPKTAREYEYNTHKITAVDIQTDDVTLVSDESVRTVGHQIYPTNADTSGLDVLHVYIPLARGSSSTSYKTCDVVTEDLPSAGISSKNWWKDKHPRLANVALSAITISEATRTGDHTYPRIAKNTAAELKEAGISFDVETFKCKCTIKSDDDEEEDIYLTMQFITTDATTRTYTWQVGSSSVAGETLPTGLAEAMYRQRTQSDYLNETMTIRLGDDLPHLGDVADGLYLQNFDVDCADLTAQLHFGQPEYLSAEDMRDLLNGFRGRSYCENAALRDETDENLEDEAEELCPIPPLSSTEFSPGTKAKTTIKSSSATGKIVLDASEVTSGSTLSVRSVSFTDADGEEKTVDMLATEDFDLPGEVTLVGGESIEVERLSSNKWKITYKEGKAADETEEEEEETSSTPCEHPEGGTGVAAGSGGGGSSGGDDTSGGVSASDNAGGTPADGTVGEGTDHSGAPCC